MSIEALTRYTKGNTTPANMLRQRSYQTPLMKAYPSASTPLDKSLSSASEVSFRGQSAAMVDDPRRPLLGTVQDEADPALSGRHAQPPSYNSYPDIEFEQEIEEAEGNSEMKNLSTKSQWVVLAVASGACAAFNGVFAKLTTTELTTSFATWIANLIGLSHVEKGVEVVVRAIFFGLNLIFNGIMWTLFTKALARGTSTTQVSILNTSSNFMITALLGLIIFSESLPPLWFLGAAMLVAGNVIIGRRDEGEEASKATLGGDEHAGENGNAEGRYTEGADDERGGLLGESVELDEDLELERKRKQDDEDILMLGSDTDEDGEQGARLI